MSRCYDDMFRDEIVELLETAQAESDRRLALLEVLEKKMVYCLVCDGRLTNFGKEDDLKNMGYEVGHAAGCELDAECNG